jgi:hypothetical protein
MSGLYKAMDERKILSFDVGAKNLAFCQGCQTLQGSFEIIRWELHNIKGKSIEDTIGKCLMFLKQNFRDISGTHVLIERQFYRNIESYVLSHVIAAFFAAKNQTVTYVDPKAKKLITKGSKARKKEAVEVVTQMLQNDPIWLSWFQTQKVKADLADSLLNIV